MNNSDNFMKLTLSLILFHWKDKLVKVMLIRGISEKKLKLHWKTNTTLISGQFLFQNLHLFWEGESITFQLEFDFLIIIVCIIKVYIICHHRLLFEASVNVLICTSSILKR